MNPLILFVIGCVFYYIIGIFLAILFVRDRQPTTYHAGKHYKEIKFIDDPELAVKIMIYGLIAPVAFLSMALAVLIWSALEAISVFLLYLIRWLYNKITDGELFRKYID